MRMLKNNLGYPRMGSHRQLKKACEQYWAGSITSSELFLVARKIKEENWQLQINSGIDLIPCNDFSLYDQVLDMTLTLGAIPQRYTQVLSTNENNQELDLYFAMARGYQKDGLDITAMEMTKWFDTNYHYLVPEFVANQHFSLFSEKVFAEYNHARQICGNAAKPVLIGPVSYLLLGKEKEHGFDRVSLIRQLIPVYIEIINRLKTYGAEWVQLDEPFLALDLSEAEKNAFKYAYLEIYKKCKGIKIITATYFEALADNTELAVSMPVEALHIDLVRAPQQLDNVLRLIDDKLILSLGVVDGRNIWKNDFKKSTQLIRKAIAVLGRSRVMVAPSCSLLHTPFDLDEETEIDPQIKNWMAFAKQKLQEVNALCQIIDGNNELLETNRRVFESRNSSTLIHDVAVKERAAALNGRHAERNRPFKERQVIQQNRFKLPVFPTTTIGSFPQTDEIRQLRAKLKKKEITLNQYEEAIKEATIAVIKWQEEIGVDVLVHGEFERNDMVEYFGEQLNGFLFTKNGWVQSYGSRCVKPPVIYGDVSRPADMTVSWTKFAQQQTDLPVKGMLTGPITILQWSFVRNDQSREETANQIAFAIRNEVSALEQAGIGIIQIDEPAIREGLPLRRAQWNSYLQWAVKAFRIASVGVSDETQIHTHMCYSEFNDIMPAIAAMDADVITIETSRSQMELLEAFANFHYPNEIGPGVYDIHSPRIPSIAEMVQLLQKAAELLPAQNIWVNPDCGLKTRKWPETKAALQNMVKAAALAREKITVSQTS
jgi:5-methyltetrahydropteroyltriglutamate--homocysteine methyltransferase